MQHGIEIHRLEGDFRIREHEREAAGHFLPLLPAGRIGEDLVLDRLGDRFRPCGDTGQHGRGLLPAVGGRGFARIEQAETSADGAQAGGQIIEALLLASRPAQAVGHEGPGDAHDVEAAVGGKAQRVPIESAALVIERRLLCVALRQDRDETARFAKRLPPIIERHVLTMTGHRHIGQMAVEREGCEHLHPVDGRPLRLVDRGGVAVVDIAVEALLDLDTPATIALPDLGDDPAWRGLDDAAEHAVLHAERVLVAQEDDLVAGGEPSLSILGLERMAGADDPALDMSLARAMSLSMRTSRRRCARIRVDFAGS